MALPFTRDQFLDVFGAYNESVWPAVVVLWLVTLATIVLHARGGPMGQRFINRLLIVHWVWAAVAYHAAFFSRVNPAAWLFSGLFLAQAGLLAWDNAARGRPQYSGGRSLRHRLSWVLLGYALVYPAFAWAEGHGYPRLPTFGVPCPTTILTIGFFLSANRPVSVAVAIIPILWAFIGGSAAFLLGVRADLMLLAAGLGFLLHMIVTRAAPATAAGKS